MYVITDRKISKNLRGSHSATSSQSVIEPMRPVPSFLALPGGDIGPLKILLRHRSKCSWWYFGEYEMR